MKVKVLLYCLINRVNYYHVENLVPERQSAVHEKFCLLTVMKINWITASSFFLLCLVIICYLLCLLVPVDSPSINFCCCHWHLNACCLDLSYYLWKEHNSQDFG